MRDVRKFGHNVNSFHKSRSCSESVSSRFLWGAFTIIVALISLWPVAVVALQTGPQKETGVTVQGNVLDSSGKAIGDALVRLGQEGTLKHLETKTNTAGAFAFTPLPQGRYVLSAEKSGQKRHTTVVLSSPGGDRKDIDLVLERSVDTRSDSSAPSPSSTQAMECSDQPNFTSAGVTDWTAVAGHGSDSALRTSEDLARETLRLKPQDSNRLGPGSSGDANKENETESKLRAALDGAPGSFDGNR